MKKIILFVTAICIAITSFATEVDTLNIYSAAMHKNIKTVVIKPSNYKKGKHFATVYLLHGYSGNYSNWVKKAPAIINYANDMQLIIVCPDGGFSSWYFDSPIDASYQYETFVGTELVNYIDSNYKTKPTANQRAITGLSMGGHGGIYVGLKHANTFGAIGSMSGALDVTYIKSRFDVEKRLGDTTVLAGNWKSHSTFAMIDTMKPTNQKIIVDCGTEDFVLPFNEQIHSLFVKRNIKHDFILRPGKHDWSYWSNAVYYQLVFFKKFFDENNAK
jgi:S-formylglutathione hydrolase FrmB